MAKDPFAELPDIGPQDSPTDPFSQLPNATADDPFAGLPDKSDPFAALPNEKVSWLDEAGRAITHGLHSAGEAAAEFAMTPMKLMLQTLTGDKNLDPFGDVLQKPLEAIEPAAPETTAGRIGETIVQFGAGMALGGAAAKIGRGTGILAAAGKGALAEQIAFDPDEERLSNIIQDVPELQNPVTEYLAASDDDSDMEARFKMAAEGMGLGAFTDSLLRGLRRMRSARKSKAIEEAAAPVPKETHPKVTLEQEPLIELSTNIAEARRKGAVPHPRPQKVEPNLNVGKLDTSDAVKAELQRIEKAEGAFAAQRRGKISWEETRRLANMVGMDEADLAALPPGSILNSEHAYKARGLLVQSGEDVVAAANRAMTEQSPDAYFKFAQQMTQHRTVQEHVAGVTAEAGRLLNQFKMVADADSKRKARAIQEIMDYYGPDKLDKAARRIASLDSPEAIAQATRDFAKHGKLDKAVEIWINSLLSNPVTHATNVTSNALVSLWSIPENFAAAALATPRRLVGKGSKDVTYWREAVARAYGMVEGIADGTRMALKVAKDPDAVLPWQAAKQELGGRAVKGKVGAAVNLPTRFLQLEDAFFQSMDYRMRLRQEAMHSGLRHGLKGKALARHVNKVLTNTPEDIALKAGDEARYLTFTNPTGKFAGHLQAMARDYPGLRFVVPFIRTPTNLMKYTLERNSPLARFTSRFKNAVKAGGRESDLAHAQMLLGIGVGMSVTKMALEGYVTGSGPTDPEQRLAWLKNNKPYSWRTSPDGEWRSYQRIEPLGMIMGLGADIGLLNAAFLDGVLGKDDMPTYEEAIAKFSAAIANNLTSKTWLQGVSDGLEVLMEPDKHADYWLSSHAASWIPAGLGQVARQEDPVLRDARTLVEKLKAKIPGYSKDVPPKIDLFGDVRTIDGSWGPDMLSPFWTQNPSNHALAHEMTRLEIDDIDMPSRSIKGVELDGHQYADYAKMAGTTATAIMDKYMRHPAWANLPDFAKKELIHKAFRKARSAASDYAAVQHGLIDEIVEKKLEKFK